MLPPCAQPLAPQVTCTFRLDELTAGVPPAVIVRAAVQPLPARVGRHAACALPATTAATASRHSVRLAVAALRTVGGRFGESPGQALLAALTSTGIVKSAP